MTKRRKKGITPEERKKRQAASRSKARISAFRSCLGLIILIVLLAVIAWLLRSAIGRRPAATAPARKTISFVIVPGKRAGDITPASSESDLVNLYGKSNVSRRNVDVGEGETHPGVVIYPDQPRKLAEVIWKDAAGRARPDSFRISGDSSDWHLDNGISLGTSLKDLEKLNGKAFQLAGFGWDYGGTVLSWNGGKLERLSGNTGRIILRLREPADAGINQAERRSVQGDGSFSSAGAVMQKMNPVVQAIVMEF